MLWITSQSALTCADPAKSSVRATEPYNPANVWFADGTFVFVATQSGLFKVKPPNVCWSSPSPAAVTSTTSSTLPKQITVTIGAWTGAKPQTIWFSGDSNNVVSGITWSSWGPQSGAGKGTWVYDNCIPDCAAGKTTAYTASLVVSKPRGGQFTQLVETQSGPYGRTLAFSLPDSKLNGASSGTQYDQ